MIFQSCFQQSFCSFTVGLQQSEQSIQVEIGSRHLEAYLECASLTYEITKVKVVCVFDAVVVLGGVLFVWFFFKCFCGLPVKMLTQSWALENQGLGCSDAYKILLELSSCS